MPSITHHPKPERPRMQPRRRLIFAPGVFALLSTVLVGLVTAQPSPAQVLSVVSIADVTVTEGAATDQVTLSMTNPAGRVCSVLVNSTNGTAVAPGDYSPFNAGLFTLNGIASDVLSVSVVDDVLVEGPETCRASGLLRMGGVVGVGFGGDGVWCSW